jgi:IS5 family transposase
MGLMSPEVGLSAGAQQRLKASWAERFRQKVVPELLAGEESFAILYADGGRPNWSVARLVGVCLLQQLQDMSDQQALDALSFDIRWQHALDIVTDDAYLSRRSLVEFRRRLVQRDPDGSLLRGVFDRICSAGVKELGIETAEQRVDSTLVMSNIRTRGRLSLARETLRVFLRSLEEQQREQLPEAIQAWYAAGSNEWELGGDSKESKVQLHEAGSWVVTLLRHFANDETVSKTEPYELLRRLATEHAEALGLGSLAVPSASERDGSDDDPPSLQAGADAQRSGPQGRKKVPSTRARYWSAHDPDASFGHKGLGYHVHVAETCRNEGTELLTDYNVVTAAQSDIGQGLPVLQRLAKRDLVPQILYADGGYPTPNDLVASRRMGSELFAPVNRGRLAVDSLSRADFEMNPVTGEVVRCPAGNRPVRHGERESSDAMQRRRAMYAFFDVDTCNCCTRRARCPVRAPNNSWSRQYRLELSPEMMARDARWVEQQAESWRERYRIRCGVEATMSELKRGHGLGRLRIRRLVRVRVQVALKATACNIKRWMGACGAPLQAVLRWLFTLIAPGTPHRVEWPLPPDPLYTA